MLRDDDAASSVLAVILMMGFVAAAAVSLFVVGTATLQDTTNSAQNQQVENTFRQLNQEVSSVAFGREKYRSMHFDIEDSDAAFRKQDTGQIKILVDGTEEVNRSVGSLVYEKKNTKLAYQAGGVWAGVGKDSRMVSEPPVEYRDGSLAFPIPELTGDENIRGGDIDITKQQTIAPINDDGYIKGKLVTVKVTSEYYMGWAEYFRTQTNDVAVSVDHSPAGPKGTVTVKLGRSTANGDFEDGVLATGGDDGDIYIDNKDSPDNLAATGEITNKDGDIDGEENVESNLYELDEAIERKMKEAEDVTSNLSDNSIEEKELEDAPTLNGPGTYYDDDGFVLDDSMKINVTNGNVTLLVDGDMEIDNGDINVTGTSSGNVVRVYTTGNYSHGNGHVGAESSASAKHFQIYGTSEMLAVMQKGSTEFRGTIYAPREEAVLDDDEANPVAPTGSKQCEGYDMCISTGSSAVTGAIVGGPTYMGQGTSVQYDSDLDTIKPTLQLDGGVLPPPITFIKVSVHEIAVNNSDTKNIQPAGGLAAGATPSVVGMDGSHASADGLQVSTAMPRRAATATRRSPLAA